MKLKFFILLITIYLFSCNTKNIETEFQYISREDTMYFYNLSTDRGEGTTLFRAFLDPEKLKISTENLQLHFYLSLYDFSTSFIPRIALVYAKKMSGDSIIRRHYTFRTAYYFWPYTLAYFKRVCKNNKYKLNLFDSLPIIRLKNLTQEEIDYREKIEKFNIENYNKLLDLIDTLDNEYSYIRLIYLTQVVPLYYNCANKYYANDDYNLWHEGGFSFFYDSDTSQKKDFIRNLDYVEKDNALLKANKKYIKNYFKEKTKIDSNIFYICTYPDFRLVKFRIEKDFHLVEKEYINWQYEALDPFYFYSAICCQTDIDANKFY
jgi:hypothetical protein